MVLESLIPQQLELINHDFIKKQQELKNLSDHVSLKTYFNSGAVDEILNYTNISTRVIAKYKNAYKIFNNDALFTHVVAHANDIEESREFTLLAVQSGRLEYVKHLFELGAPCQTNDILYYLSNESSDYYRMHLPYNLFEYLLSFDIRKNGSIYAYSRILYKLVAREDYINLYLDHLQTMDNCAQILNSSLFSYHHNTVLKKLKKTVSNNTIRRMIDMGINKRKGYTKILQRKTPYIFRWIIST